MQTITATWREYALTCDYDETGLAWVDLSDNAVLGWAADETCTLPATPIILGSSLLRTVAPFTGVIISPRWVLVNADFNCFVPDHWRGTAPDLFSFLALNNGAQRQVGGSSLFAPYLQNAFADWGRLHPELVWPGAAS